MVDFNNNSIHANITLYGEKLEEVDKFCYPGSTLTIYGSCEADIRIRLALASSAMVWLYTILNSKQITFNQMRSDSGSSEGFLRMGVLFFV